jgi:hypothetical protein
MLVAKSVRIHLPSKNQVFPISESLLVPRRGMNQCGHNHRNHQIIKLQKNDGFYMLFNWFVVGNSPVPMPIAIRMMAMMLMSSSLSQPQSKKCFTNGQPDDEHYKSRYCSSDESCDVAGKEIVEEVEYDDSTSTIQSARLIWLFVCLLRVCLQSTGTANQKSG